MVSYYNTLPYSQKHSAANLAYSAGQPWQWPANYHTPPNHQFLGDMDSPQPHHHMYYNPHHMFHTTASAASDWHTPAASADNFVPNVQTSSSHHHMLQQHHANVPAAIGATTTVTGSSSSSSSSTASNSAAVAVLNASNTNLNDTVGSIGEQHIAEGLPSPPITVSAGSEISSPGAPASSSPHHITAHHPNHNNNNNNNNSSSNNNNSSTNSNNNHNHNTQSNTNNNNNNNNNSNRSSPVKAQYYDWMKKPSYPAQPTPGKTRTKDKYRVVYTDYQRLELEKEYCTSRYITIRRKTELAQSLSLSERQVKIWFQNRRAKERKQNKKGSDATIIGGVQHPDYANLMDTKPKLEPGLHLQHSLHSMAAMSMPTMSLHHHLHSHHPLAAHQLHQSSHAQMSAAAALSM